MTASKFIRGAIKVDSSVIIETVIKFNSAFNIPKSALTIITSEPTSLILSSSCETKGNLKSSLKSSMGKSLDLRLVVSRYYVGRQLI